MNFHLENNKISVSHRVSTDVAHRLEYLFFAFSLLIFVLSIFEVVLHK